MSAFQSTKCSNVLKSDKYGKCTHAYTQIHSADVHTHTPPCRHTHLPPWRYLHPLHGQMGDILQAKIIKQCIVCLFIHYLALHNTEVPFNAMCCHPFRMKKGEERLIEKKKKTRITHVNIVTSSLTFSGSEPTKLQSKGGFRLSQHRLCCWVSGTVNADNKLWKCFMFTKGLSAVTS